MTQAALLIPVRVEVWRRRNGRAPTPHWVDGYQIITPRGTALLPYMRKRQAIRYCKLEGWAHTT